MAESASLSRMYMGRRLVWSVVVHSLAFIGNEESESG